MRQVFENGKLIIKPDEDQVELLNNEIAALKEELRISNENNLIALDAVAQVFEMVMAMQPVEEAPVEPEEAPVEPEATP